MLFDRVKSLDHILESAEKEGLKRQLGWFDLMMLGMVPLSEPGIFVLTSVAAKRAGPGMMYSFVIAGFVCAVSLCYSRIGGAMVPVSGSAYTYSYAVMGELLAWISGWVYL